MLHLSSEASHIPHEGHHRSSNCTGLGCNYHRPMSISLIGVNKFPFLKSHRPTTGFGTRAGVGDLFFVAVFGVAIAITTVEAIRPIAVRQVVAAVTDSQLAKTSSAVGAPSLQPFGRSAGWAIRLRSSFQPESS